MAPAPIAQQEVVCAECGTKAVVGLGVTTMPEHLRAGRTAGQLRQASRDRHCGCREATFVRVLQAVRA